jgi:hypothetical protein
MFPDRAAHSATDITRRYRWRSGQNVIDAIAQTNELAMDALCFDSEPLIF